MATPPVTAKIQLILDQGNQIAKVSVAELKDTELIAHLDKVRTIYTSASKEIDALNAMPLKCVYATDQLEALRRKLLKYVLEDIEDEAPPPSQRVNEELSNTIALLDMALDPTQGIDISEIVRLIEAINPNVMNAIYYHMYISTALKEFNGQRFIYEHFGSAAFLCQSDFLIDGKTIHVARTDRQKAIKAAKVQLGIR